MLSVVISDGEEVGSALIRGAARSVNRSDRSRILKDRRSTPTVIFLS